MPDEFENIFPPHYARKNVRTTTITDILDTSMYVRNTQGIKSMIIVMPFKNVVCCPHETEKPVFLNSSGLKGSFEKLLFVED